MLVNWLLNFELSFILDICRQLNGKMNAQEAYNFLGLPLTTKEMFAKELGVSKVTLYKYHDVAIRLQDFSDDYPVVRGKPDTSAPLTEYQKWVLSMMVRLFKHRRVSFLYAAFKSQVAIEKFSRQAYELDQQQTTETSTAIEVIGVRQ